MFIIKRYIKFTSKMSLSTTNCKTFRVKRILPTPTKAFLRQREYRFIGQENKLTLLRMMDYCSPWQVWILSCLGAQNYFCVFFSDCSTWNQSVLRKGLGLWFHLPALSTGTWCCIPEAKDLEDQVKYPSLSGYDYLSGCQVLMPEGWRNARDQ